MDYFYAKLEQAADDWKPAPTAASHANRPPTTWSIGCAPDSQK